MGAWLSSVFDRLFTRCKPGRVLLLGLDNAGKTTLLQRVGTGVQTNDRSRPCHVPSDILRPGIPTVGFNMASICVGRFTFDAWDVGGQDILRPLWRHFYQDALAVIFVVDGT